jgi:cell wall assembly regulator SMI1
MRARAPSVANVAVEIDPSEIAYRTWRTLELRLAREHPALLERLPAGADPRTLERVENRLGTRLPELVRGMYLLHDGIGMPAVRNQITCASYFLCLDDALEEWQAQTEALRAGRLDGIAIEYTKGPVRAQCWNARWFPITADGGGNHHCVDMDPTDGGKRGQIISFWHDDVSREVDAGDIATFLLDYVDEHRVETWAIGEGLKRPLADDRS